MAKICALYPLKYNHLLQILGQPMALVRSALLLVILIIFTGCTYVRYASEGSTVADRETATVVLKGILLFEAKGGKKPVGISAFYAKYDKDLPLVSDKTLPKIESIEMVAEMPRQRIERWVVQTQGQLATYKIHFSYVVGGGGPDTPLLFKPDFLTVSKFEP